MEPTANNNPKMGGSIEPMAPPFFLAFFAAAAAALRIPFLVLHV